MKRIYGYVRVSTKEQNEDRQMIVIEGLKVPKSNIFVDKQSGKDFERPMYKQMINKLRNGDVLYVKSIDRLGRNYDEIIEQWKKITKEKKADIVVTDMPLLDTRREKNLMGVFVSDLVLQILSFVAENERRNIRQRQREGIVAAKLRGVKFGRPNKISDEKFREIYEKWQRKEIDIDKAVSLCKISKSTFYRKGKKLRENLKQ